MDNKWLVRDGLHLGHLNVCHLFGKLDQLSLVISCGFHLFGVSESRLNDRISDDDIGINRFQFVRQDAIRKNETGIAVYISNSITFTLYVQTSQNKAHAPLLIEGFLRT